MDPNINNSETVSRLPAASVAALVAACAQPSELSAAIKALMAVLESHKFEPQTVDPSLMPDHTAYTGEYLANRNPETDILPSASTRIEPGMVMLGRYKLQQLLGEGGMGEVWGARQIEPVKRMVAVKLIKANVNSKAVLARFEHERQALALMDHPNIAKILDGGLTPAGQPFFVMELVPGLPLTQYCDQGKLTLGQRLELFIAICRAVHHAHQKGVIHRDLKPSNILVADMDGRPTPKVIDFGLAKATTAQLSDQTMCTQYGAIVGTLEYMAPEQAAADPRGIDTRADIYSLGAVLYELLTGGCPHDRRRHSSNSIVDTLRIIKEVEPDKPSTRLSLDPELLSAVAARRRIESTKLRRVVRGELDWIVMKALEKDRTRRYDSACSFADDVRRYLTGEAVEACPPSASYQLRKFAHRYRRLLAMTALCILTLIAAVLVSLRETMRATEAERRAVQDRDRAERATSEADEAHFRRLTEERTHVLQGGLGDALEHLTAIAAAMDTWPTLTRTEFRTFVVRALDRHPEIQALEWVPWVSDSNRMSVEKNARSEQITDFVFRETDPAGGSRPASTRPDYYPVMYVEPMERNRAAIGLDLGASPPRRQAIELARDTGRPVASAPVRLAQENASGMGFLLFQPVYNGLPDTLEERRQAFRGCAVAVFRTTYLVDRVLGELAQGQVAMDIFDDETKTVIYQSQIRPASDGVLKTVHRLDVAGRCWRLEFVSQLEQLGSLSGTRRR